MSEIDTTKRTPSDLGRYVSEVLYKDFSNNRKDLVKKWGRNRAAIAGNPALDSSGLWQRPTAADDWQSQSILNVTRQKCVSCSVLFEDAILKGGRIPFMLTPLDDQPVDAAEIEDPDLEQVNEQEDQIHHQFERCAATREVKLCIRSYVNYGCFWAKRYSHSIVDESFVEVYPGIFEEGHAEEEALGFEHVSNWKMFWDLEEKDIRKGRGIIQEDFITPYKLRSMIGKPYYLEEGIKQAILAGSDNQVPSTEETELPPELQSLSSRKKTISHKEFWGRVPRPVAERFEKFLKEHGTADTAALNFEEHELLDGDEVEITCSVSNGFVTRYVATNDPAERPYYYGEFEENHEQAGGLGMADAVENDQLVLNNAIRSFEDNKRLASSLILALKRNLLEDDFTGLDKAVNLIDLAEECSDATKAIQQILVVDVGESLLKLIEMYLEFVDLNSFMPRAQQGQISMQEETATQFMQRLEKSGKYIGSAVRNFDDFIVALVRDFHRYNMLNPDNPNAKGSYKVKALGFTSFENKVIRLQKLLQMLNLLMSNERLAGETKLRWLVGEIAKALDLDPDHILLNAAEKGELQKQQQDAQENDPNYQAALRKMELELQQQEINNSKVLAETQAIVERIKQETAKLDLQRAEFLKSITAEVA